MGSTAIPWIMLGSAVAAAVSAFFSWRSSRTAINAAATAADAAKMAADTAATSLILKFRDQYATNKMRIDLRNLRAWYDRHGSSKFAKTWQEKLEQNDKDALIVDASRRRVASFFSNIIDLHDTGLVPKRIEKLLTDFAGFDLLYIVVEPLERALSPDYDKARFEKLRKLRPPGDGLTQYFVGLSDDPVGCGVTEIGRRRGSSDPDPRGGDGRVRQELAEGARVKITDAGRRVFEREATHEQRRHRSGEGPRRIGGMDGPARVSATGSWLRHGQKVQRQQLQVFARSVGACGVE
jgi:hypothetical protein